MRLQIIDPSLRFECRSCGLCCDHPWRVTVDPETLTGLEAVDWGHVEPALRGRRLFRQVRLGRRRVTVLEKGDGNKCIFLDEQRLCRIHKHLGFDAKPRMCRWFPFSPSVQPDADYVSASYGCPAIQNGDGPPATEQRAAIATAMAVSAGPAQPLAPVRLTNGVALPHAAGRDLIARMGAVMVGTDSPAGSQERSLPGRLLTALEMLSAALPAANPGATDLPSASFSSAREAPLACRFLFAATMASDALPPGAIDGLKLFHRWTLIPRLMSLAQMQGAYPSMMLQCNVRVDEIMCRPAAWAIPPEGLALLGRCSRSRLWQQFPSRSATSLLAGFHQHILDLNSIVFLAAARAMQAGRSALDVEDIRAALHWVEFQIANQSRVHDEVLKGWVSGALDHVELARHSIRMLRCAAGAAAGAEVSTAR